MNQAFYNQIAQHYTKKVNRFGANLQGIGWNSEEAQHLRFVQLAKIIQASENQPFSICDYGCGLADFDDFLSGIFHSYNYYGYDVSEKMIEAAKRKHLKANFIMDSQLNADYDYLVACGIFNVKQFNDNEPLSDGEWTEYILSTIRMFQNHTKKGFAFNCLTKYSDSECMKEHLYYADPTMLFDYCKKNFSRNVALLHDYELYDFTILVRKELQ